MLQTQTRTCGTRTEDREMEGTHHYTQVGEQHQPSLRVPRAVSRLPGRRLTIWLMRLSSSRNSWFSLLS